MAEQTFSIQNDFGTLQSLMDEVLGKIGLKKTIALLKTVVNDDSLELDATSKNQLIVDYLVGHAVAIYGLKQESFFDTKVRNFIYSEARQACMHLMKKYTPASYSMVGEYFESTKRNAVYAWQNFENILQEKHFHEEKLSRYLELESRLLTFLTHF